MANCSMTRLPGDGTSNVVVLMCTCTLCTLDNPARLLLTTILRVDEYSRTLGTILTHTLFVQKRSSASETTRYWLQPEVTLYLRVWVQYVMSSWPNAVA